MEAPKGFNLIEVNALRQSLQPQRKRQRRDPDDSGELINRPRRSRSVPPQQKFRSLRYSSLRRSSLPASMDSDRQSARDALWAAQVTLADGLTWLRVVSAVRGGRAPPEEGESFVTARAGGGTLLLPSGMSLCGQLSQFLLWELGFLGIASKGGSSGERTILPSDHGSVGGPFQILNGFKTRVDTPLTAGERGDSRLLGETREGGMTSQTSSVFGLGAFS